jgi:Outer membrane protein beta-barrel domain
MHRLAVTAALFVSFAAITPRDASAQVGQSWLDRGYLNLSAGFESVSGGLTDARTFRLYDENGSLSVNQSIDSGALFDFSVGARVWQNVSVGIGFHREATSGEGSLTASVPNPVVTDQNRTGVAASASDLNRSERAFHLQLGYMLPLSDRMSVHFMLGPSFFNVKQDVIGDATFTEGALPNVTATPAIVERSESATGFHIGADATFLLLDSNDMNLGAGVFLRYAAATADVQVLDNRVGTDAGGLQIGFGGRLRF